jgi:hypothetical protein
MSLANRRLIDPSASRTGLAVRCRQAANPDRYAKHEDVGRETKFHQPDFVHGPFCFVSETKLKLLRTDLATRHTAPISHQKQSRRNAS